MGELAPFAVQSAPQLQTEAIARPQLAPALPKPRFRHCNVWLQLNMFKFVLEFNEVVAALAAFIFFCVYASHRKRLPS
jgi:hypothetical protein